MISQADQERFFAETTETSSVVGFSAGLDDEPVMHVVDHKTSKDVSIPLTPQTLDELEALIHLYRAWERGTQCCDRASPTEDMWSGH